MTVAPSPDPVVHVAPLPDGSCRITFSVARDLALGSPRRESELRHRLTRVLKRLKAGEPALVIDPAGTRLTATTTDRAAADALLARLSATLALVLAEPLYPRVVEEALGITPRERLRWTKDGRLPATDGNAVRRGARAFRVPRYPVAAIAALAASPATIAGWRADDRQAPGAGA
ncbi:hypothetical protein ACRC7T_17035 [Segnochrobactraceae bacterium EtOH-i3]